MGTRLVQALFLGFLCQAALAQAAGPFADDRLEALSPTPVSAAVAEKGKTAAQRSGPGPSGANASAQSPVPTYAFNATRFPGFYDAKSDRSRSYNIPQILKDIPAMWASYGRVFKRVGSELGVDPYALAASCVFESYSSSKHNFNPRMKDVAGGMYAAGIAATQAQDVKGTRVPGLKVVFPQSTERTAEVLRNNPEYAIRCLASEFKEAYAKTGDLAKTFPKVALPSWKNPKSPKGAYGTQAQYVSRAFVFYQAFRAADGK